jgi:ClpP class serine protease
MLNLLQYKAWALEETFFNQWAHIVLSGHIDRFIKPVSLQDHLTRIVNLVELGAEEGMTAAELAPNDIKLSYDMNGQLQVPVFKVGGQNIAVLPVIGTLTKYNDLCSMGMQSLQTLFNRLNANPQIHGTVMLGDTPGGTVDGTPEFAVAIKNSPKPVGWFADNLTASAGLWLASQCSVIIGNKNNPTALGSIGAMRAMQNFSKMMEIGNMPEVHLITAPQSKDKVKHDPTKSWTEEDLKAMSEEARPYAAMIIDAVKAGRGDKLDTSAEGLFTGGMFDVTKAKQIGLIDGVGTLQTALNKVAELVRSQNSAIKSVANTQSNTSAERAQANMKFPKLSSLFSGEAWGKALSAFTEDEAPLEAAEQKVATMEADLVKATGEKAAAETRATSAEAKVTELNTQVSTLTSEKASLEATVALQKTALDAKPTGQATTVITDSREENQANEESASKKKSFRSKADDEADAIVAASFPNLNKK